jgi:Leucine-rich repeat (LRR) protein
VLSLKSNGLCADGGKALAKGLKGNTVITELGISSNDLGENSDYEPDMSGVIALADAIPDMTALSLLSLKDNRLATKEGGKALAQALASNSTLKELDVSSNNWQELDVSSDWMGDGPGFSQELAVGIKDNGALLSLNLSSNYIGVFFRFRQFNATPEGRVYNSFCKSSRKY